MIIVLFYLIPQALYLIMSNRYIKYFKPNFNDGTMQSNLIERNMRIKKKILNFKTLKVHRLCDKVLDNIK